MWVEIIVAVAVFGFIFGAAYKSFEEKGYSGAIVSNILIRIILFIPVTLAAVAIHVYGDFKNHKIGYIALFLILGLIITGFILSLNDPAGSPSPVE